MSCGCEAAAGRRAGRHRSAYSDGACVHAADQPVCSAAGAVAGGGVGGVAARLAACRGGRDGVEGRKVSALIAK